MWLNFAITFLCHLISDVVHMYGVYVPRSQGNWESQGFKKNGQGK